MVVTTLAGSDFGFLDGSGAAAKFKNPFGVTADPQGNLYVTDTQNNCIRKITAAGAVTTIAGQETAGLVDGKGAAAKFNSPHGIAIDPSGNLYVADTNNYSIRKITPDGSVTTLAGGTLGSHDGTGTTAQFSSITGIVYDETGGMLYATDGNCIRKVTSAGTVTTFAGIAASGGYIDAIGASARFNYPNGLACDPQGDVFVADSSNHRIRKISPDGNVTTVAGGGSGNVNGSTSSARFNSPRGIAIDPSSGAIYVADTFNYQIRLILGGQVTTLSAGYGTDDGPIAQARFGGPMGMVRQGSIMYVVDCANNRIRKLAQ